MFLSEPAPTQADLHFRLFGFPVRVHPYFWVVTVLLGLGGRGRPTRSERVDVGRGRICFDIGARNGPRRRCSAFYGGHPWITLYSFGGLASCNDCDRSPRQTDSHSHLPGRWQAFFLRPFVIAIIKLSGHPSELRR